jgi:hypothetical protein
MGFFSKRQRPPEVRTQRKIRFLCEQDGDPERELKALLAPKLAPSDVKRAYLARVEYDDPSAYEVALCVRGVEDPSLVRTVASQFAAVFGADKHLDIIFLTDAQEEELARVCGSFYRAV